MTRTTQGTESVVRKKHCLISNLSSLSQIVIRTMYRTAFRAGRQVYSSKLWRTIDLPTQSRSLAATITLARYSSNTTEKFSLEQIAPARDAFTRRHIGPNAVEEKEMLRTLNLQVNILHIASYCVVLRCFVCTFVHSEIDRMAAKY